MGLKYHLVLLQTQPDLPWNGNLQQRRIIVIISIVSEGKTNQDFAQTIHQIQICKQPQVPEPGHGGKLPVQETEPFI